MNGRSRPNATIGSTLSEPPFVAKGISGASAEQLVSDRALGERPGLIDSETKVLYDGIESFHVFQS